MSIDAVKVGISNFAAVKPITQYQQAENLKPKAASGESFKDVFSSAIKEVDGLQKQANQQIENVMLGKPGATTHDAMIALEKADTAFQLMNNIRAKIIKAYEDVLRTQV